MESGNYSHINEFVPIFRALNDANSVAIDCISRVHAQEHPRNSQQPVNSHPVQSQQPQQQSVTTPCSVATTIESPSCKSATANAQSFQHVPGDDGRPKSTTGPTGTTDTTEPNDGLRPWGSDGFDGWNGRNGEHPEHETW